jgi:hypothetical protein
MLPAKISKPCSQSQNDQNHNKFSCPTALVLLLIVQQIVEIAGTG